MTKCDVITGCVMSRSICLYIRACVELYSFFFFFGGGGVVDISHTHTHTHTHTHALTSSVDMVPTFLSEGPLVRRPISQKGH